MPTSMLNPAWSQVLNLARQKVLVPALALLLFGLAFALAHWVDTLWLQQDDAYITYQYARRIAQGHGFSYSPGAPPTYGTTTPLWTLLLALFALLGCAPHITAPWLTALLHAATAALILLIGASLGCLAAGLFAGLCYALALTVFFRTGGMETALLTALTALLALSLLRSRRRCTPGILLGLLLLTRPDAAILAALVFAAWLPRPDRRPLLRSNLAATAITYAPWALYTLATFHDIVPSALRAKIAVPRISGLMNLHFLVASFFPGAAGLPFLAFALAFAALGGAVLSWQLPRLRPFVVWIPLYYLVLHLGRAPNFNCYYVPPLWFALLLAGIGLECAAQSSPARWRRPAFTVVSLALLLLFSRSQYDGIGQLFLPDYKDYHYEVAQRARTISKPGDLIAAQEVGHLAYWTGRPILDMLSLVSPEVRLRSAHHNWGAIIRHWKPDFVVVHAMDGLPELEHGYTDVYRLRIWTRKDYTIWQRQDHPDP